MYVGLLHDGWLKIFTQNRTSNVDLLTSYCALSIPSSSILVQQTHFAHKSVARTVNANYTHTYRFVTKRTCTKLHDQRIRNSLCSEPCIARDIRTTRSLRLESEYVRAYIGKTAQHNVRRCGFDYYAHTISSVQNVWWLPTIWLCLCWWTVVDGWMYGNVSTRRLLISVDLCAQNGVQFCIYDDETRYAGCTQRSVHAGLVVVGVRTRWYYALVNKHTRTHTLTSVCSVLMLTSCNLLRR